LEQPPDLCDIEARIPSPTLDTTGKVDSSQLSKSLTAALQAPTDPSRDLQPEFGLQKDSGTESSLQEVLDLIDNFLQANCTTRIFQV
jgi:hypothetical protein